jgi:SAM-dependent methyltransferase
MDREYDRGFFEHNQLTSSTSASIVVPIVNEWVAPSSVVDLGCGTGSWLSQFSALGVGAVCGIDGDFVDRTMLTIPVESFVAHDLREEFVATRRFDLAISLEVAEHLPEACGPSLVTSLTALAPVVLFSAAIPHQGGVNHVNCQWPAYWAELFASHGFVVVDALRTRLWDNDEVAWWYRQNAMIYVEEAVLADYPRLAELRRHAPASPPSLVHPMLLEWWTEWGISQSKLYWKIAHRQEEPP